jgi:hypothetical protein
MAQQTETIILAPDRVEGAFNHTLFVCVHFIDYKPQGGSSIELSLGAMGLPNRKGTIMVNDTLAFDAKEGGAFEVRLMGFEECEKGHKRPILLITQEK